MRSRSGSDASVLSIQRVCAGVSGARGLNGPGSGVGGAGSGVGAGRGMDATAVELGRAAGSGAGLRAHDTDRSATAIVRLRSVLVAMWSKVVRGCAKRDRG